MARPGPLRPYEPLRGLQQLGWLRDDYGGHMTDWGTHNINIARWGMGVEAPLSVSECGGRYATRDSGEAPAVQEMLCEVAGGV